MPTPTAHPELPTDQVTVSVVHSDDPTADERAQVPADVAAELERGDEVPLSPPPGYRRCGPLPWYEP